MERGEDLDSLTTKEVLKSKNKDMMMEVTFLKDLISMKNEESSKIKAELCKKKKVNFELSELVLKLKERISRQNSQNDGESEDTDENENHMKPFIRSSRRKCLQLPSFNSGCKRQASSSPDEVRSSKRITRSNSTVTSDIFDPLLHTPKSKSIRFVKSGGKRRVTPSPDETISYNRITRSNSKRMTCTGEILDPLPHTPKPNSPLSFKSSSGSRQKEILTNPYSSSCSEGGHEETYQDSLYPKVNFTIITEEKNSFGKHIHDLKCAMRPQVTVKQVKRSFCKRMGLDRDKISLKLFGDDVFDEMEMSDDLTIQVCEGRIVVAVKKVKAVEMERNSIAKVGKSLDQVQGNLSGEILTEVEKSVNVVIKNHESMKEVHVEVRPFELSDNPKDVAVSNDQEEVVEEEARSESLKEQSWKLWRECGDKDFDTFSFDYRFFHERMANLKMIGIFVDELVSSVFID